MGGGDLAFTSTATKASKFGLPITDGTKSRIMELFKTHKWLSGVHFHVGSQGVPLDLFVQGAKICFDFVQDLMNFVILMNFVAFLQSKLASICFYHTL